MNKEELRRLYISKRKCLSNPEIQQKSKLIFEKFVSNFNVVRNENIHIFLSIDKFNEVDTRIFIDYFLDKGAKIYVPKMMKNKLIAVELKGREDLKQNSFGILEPSAVENECSTFSTVITPLLYADQEGNRVGYGKGFYDSFFKEINSDAQKIGVSFFLPLETISDVSTNDIALDYLITPEVMLSFKGLEKKSKK